MKGLKQQLNDYLESENGRFVSLSTIHKLAAEGNYKQRTAERCLNKSLSPNVLTHYDNKGQVSGYSWIKPMSEAAKRVMEWNSQFKVPVKPVSEPVGQKGLF